MAEKEYIERDSLLKLISHKPSCPTTDREDRLINGIISTVKNYPAADVLPRDEAIKMGAELAAMHGSDATSQQLEEAYLKGVEYGMTRRDVRPVVLCRDCKYGQGAKMDFWGEYEGIECIGGVVHRKDWFCADGEKREE